jgi:hypothetical protein
VLPVRYIVGFIGAVFVFVSVFILSSLFVAYGPALLRYEVALGLVTTNNPFGLLLAAVAGTLSFRGTLRHYARGKHDKGAKG